PPGSPQSITSDGYEKALELREELGIDSELPLVGELDLEASIIRERLGITVQEVFLDDTGIDGVALAGPHLAPSIIINKSGRASSRPTGRRSTLAHELCHLLFDGQSEGYVGVVSNDWADYALERRANAFAAMLLAPAEAIEKILGPKAIKREQKDILEAMQKLDIGLVMLTRQMQNLGWLSESEQQALIQDFTTT
ncbi:ImmA/IrrE family metallo-endopeptidase, partial [Myxococcota bacterium]|nr:ImmA/IrrE family metallo-endopeptidase [Myxococcota bacterium]